jgi:hypothetical protein
MTSPKGAKTELIQSAIQTSADPFRVVDIQRQCPGVSIDLIREVLKRLRASGEVECLGRGQQAHWQKLIK